MSTTKYSDPVFITLPRGRTLTTGSATNIKPTTSFPRVLVVGAGVTCLVATWVLLDRGYQVTILSKTWANHSPNNRLISQIAGALWEYPPAVCGSHTDETS